MKRSLLFLAGVLFAMSGANAQITLNSFTYTPPSTDSFKTTTVASTYPSFAAATNASWDVSSVTDSTADILVYHVSSSALSSTYADSSGYSFGGYAYQGDLLSAITSGGIVEYGLSTPGAVYSLTSVTGGASDNLSINNQTAAYSSTATVVKFPATMSTSWSSSFNSTINFTITAALLSYSNTPGYIISYTTRHDTVIGWGQMKVKTASGGTSGYMNVLQVRTQINRMDSFYVNGAPASGTLLTGIGVTQGQVTKIYEQNFYRANELSPLVTVTFSDSANTTPTNVTTHEQRLAAPSAVANVTNDNWVKVYPNPVTGRIVSVDVTTAGNWSYELLSVTGQSVVAGNLQAGIGHSQVTIPAPVAPGTYYMRIFNDSKQVAVRPLEIR